MGVLSLEDALQLVDLYAEALATRGSTGQL